MPTPECEADMQTTALAAASQAKPPRTTRKERRSVTGRVKIACDAMVYEGLSWQDAAEKAKLHVRSMRLALERPIVIQYLKAQKQVFREAASAQNIHELVQLRSQSGNAMAKLGAIKVLEQLSDDPQASTSRQSVPGIVIMVGSGSSVSAHQRGIEDKPLITHEVRGDDEA